MTKICKCSAGFATHRRGASDDEIPQDMAIPSHRWPGVPWEHRMSHGHKAVMGSSGHHTLLIREGGRGESPEQSEGLAHADPSHSLERLDSFIDAISGKRLTYARLTA
jgi:hypothetical protein